MAIFHDIDELLDFMEKTIQAEQQSDDSDDDAIAKNTPGEHGRTNNTYYDER